MIVGEIAPLIQTLGLILGPTGAAWIGVKVSLNGTRDRVKRIEEKVDVIATDMGVVKERVRAVEVKAGI